MYIYIAIFFMNERNYLWLVVGLMDGFICTEIVCFYKNRTGTCWRDS